MGDLRLSVTVDAPPEIVFQTATDFAQLAAFVPGIQEVEFVCGGPVGLGTRFRETRTMFGRDATEEMTVTGWEPPHRVALSSVSCGCRIVCEHRFRPEGDGAVVEFVMTPQPQGALARLMMILMAPLTWMMSRTMRTMIADDLAALKAEAERRARVGPDGGSPV
ncbi:MAG: hypothetical protein CMJ58_18580 [Planctomycetaceae bacterium]|nr:hypothetical protein [Planctomycetaceae bacterium]